MSRIIRSPWIAAGYCALSVGIASGMLAPQPARAQPPAAVSTTPQSAVMVVVRRINLSPQIQRKLVERQIDLRTIRDDIADSILNDLTQGGIAVVRRDVMMQMLQEQNLQFEGIVDPATAARAGRVAGARFVLLATIDGNLTDRLLEKQFHSTIHYDIVDVQSSVNVKIPGADGVSDGKVRVNLLDDVIGSANSSDAWRESPFGKSLAKASADLVKELKNLRATTWTVLNVDGAEAVIEGGSAANHAAGMRLEICHIREVAGFRKETVVAECEVIEAQASRSLVKIVRLLNKDVPVEAGYIVREPRGANVAARP